MVENHGWGWVDTAVSIVMGIGAGISAAFKWFGKRFKGLDDRLNATVGITVDQGREIMMLQAQEKINEARHGDTMERLERIDAKQDAQMEMLNDIQAKCSGQRREHH